MNETEALSDTARINADFKNNSFFAVKFCDFPCFLDASDCQMLLRMIGEIKVSRDMFRYVFVVFPLSFVVILE